MSSREDLAKKIWDDWQKGLEYQNNMDEIF